MATAETGPWSLPLRAILPRKGNGPRPEGNGDTGAKTAGTADKTPGADGESLKPERGTRSVLKKLDWTVRVPRTLSTLSTSKLPGTIRSAEKAKCWVKKIKNERKAAATPRDGKTKGGADRKKVKTKNAPLSQSEGAREPVLDPEKERELADFMAELFKLAGNDVMERYARKIEAPMNFQIPP